MNNILQLKGQINHRPNSNRPGPINLPKSGFVEADKIMRLKKELESILLFWQRDKRIEGALISVHYIFVVAKSNRLKVLLGEKGKNPNASIRGAKFEGAKGDEKHVFTYYNSIEALERSIEILDSCYDTLQKSYGGRIDYNDIENINKSKKDIGKLKKTAFVKAVVDAYWVSSFEIDKADLLDVEQAAVTLYKTKIPAKNILKMVGIDSNSVVMIDDATVVLKKEQLELLHNSMPYMIAAQIYDFSKADYNAVVAEEDIITIPNPANEPIVGVIDTHFDDSVYFSKWVDYRNCLVEDIPIGTDDKKHGTAVSSIIVDGPSFNPELEDNCGRFRVRHFGVALQKGFYFVTVIKMIRDIVAANRDIKVWNLSLGSPIEIEPNFISPAAAELDRIQYEYDVIFIVAGTNNKGDNKNMKIGSPADSLNSLVVNSVDFNNKSASYSRKGPVLSFFYKPDISYYGGDTDKKIKVCDPTGEAFVSGTSFAAPWITRKMAYLIHIMGFSREVAKALIIDSAAGWNRKDINSDKMGYGIVPIKIEDILTSQNNEIKFYINGTAEEYETFTYNIPVPRDDKGFPYFAKATLVYFPKCDRNQGVDYTSTELDIHFGRIMEKDGKATIKSIDNNIQAEGDFVALYEAKMRQIYRKWDNVKHIAEKVRDNGKAKKQYESGLWGLSIKSKDRSDSSTDRSLQFGVVITLSEMNGVNRISEFIKLCMMRNWIVNTVDIQNRIDIYNLAEEDIILE